MADIPDIASWLRSSQGWKSVLASGVAVLVAATATLVLHVPDPASADTFVRVAREAQVFLPDGSSHAAAEGERLPRGARLQTGGAGGAQLTTAGRVVYVGALSTLTVLDGVREQLSKGQAMVDARDGARLELDTPAGLVRAGKGSVVRVEELALQRVAVFAGTATLQAAGRSATTTVPRLKQVRVQAGSLPQRPTALVLRSDDPWEKAVAADLVAADTELNGLANGLADTTGASYLTTAPVSFRSGPIPPAGEARGEEALTVAVARAARHGAASDVRAYRAENGSWGVVAALVQADVDAVSDVLSTSLAPDAAGPGTTSVDAGAVPDLPGFGTPSRPTPGSTTQPTTGPTGRPSTRPTLTPTTSPAPGLVSGLVDTVVGLLPTPISDPLKPVLSPAKPLLPLPAPSSTPTGLLGGVLGQ